MKKRKGKHSKAFEWIQSYNKCRNWFSKYDVPKLLEDNDNICKISDFLPSFVADEIFNILDSIDDHRWNETAAQANYTQNNIDHKFSSIKTAPGLDQVLRMFSIILEDQLSVFSAAKYTSADHIDPHDDKAYTQVELQDTRQVITCSRDIAVIYYLTKDWTEEKGGLLIDLQTNTTYIPEYNSCIMFKIPRMHQVTAVMSADPRYSIFGWYLQPGKLYELDVGIIENGSKRKNDDDVDSEDSDSDGDEDSDGDDNTIAPQCKLAQRILMNEKKRKKIDGG